jgi:Recombination endonuclease VII
VTPSEKRDKYLQKKFRISLAEYEAKRNWQNGACAICDKIPTPEQRPLEVDHDHSFLRKHKIRACGQKSNWKAWAEGTLIVGHGDLRREAVEDVRTQLIRASIRGLLDHVCNRGLPFFRDNPELLRSAADYLERFENG